MAFFTASSLALMAAITGLTIRTRDTLFGFAVFIMTAAPSMARPSAACCGPFLLCRAIVGSRFGRVALRGARENPIAWQRLGFEVFRESTQSP